MDASVSLLDLVSWLPWSSRETAPTPTTAPWWFILFGGFVGALFTQICAFIFNHRQSKKAARSQKISELIRLIGELTDLSASTWSLDGQKLPVWLGADAGKGEREIARDTIRKNEAQIGGLQIQIDELWQSLSPKDLEKIGQDELWAELLEAVTGGQFSNPERASDPERVSEVYAKSAVLTAEIRKHQ